MARGQLLSFLLLFAVAQVHARSVSIFDGYSVPWSPYVNLSSSWLLPEEGYPVFYRYFKDRITWYEADAVCQFHHGHLVTIDSAKEFDAARAYLKELDVANFVWTGLKRTKSSEPFLWPESQEMSEKEGRWAVEVPRSEEPLCAATDPSADFRWQPLPCGGPPVAAFICQINVPEWALERGTGCLLTSIPSLTVTFLPDQGAVELVADCGLAGTRRVLCKGQFDRSEMLRQLSCESGSTEGTLSSSSNSDASSSSYSSSSSEDISAAAAAMSSSYVISTSSRSRRGTDPPTSLSPPLSTTNLTKEVLFMNTATTDDVTTTSDLLSSRLGETVSASELAASTGAASSDSAASSHRAASNEESSSLTSLTTSPTSAPRQLEVAVEIRESDRISSSSSSNKKVKRTKPIPPSLRGNTPFSPTPAAATGTGLPSSSSTSVAPLLLGDSTSTDLDSSSSGVLRNSNNGTSTSTEEPLPPPESHEALGELGTGGSGGGGGAAGSGGIRLLASSKPPGGLHQHRLSQMEEYKKNAQDSGEDQTEELGSSTLETPTEERMQGDSPGGSLTGGGSGPVSSAEDQPEKPNRGRLLTHPQRHSFYAYFLNRVLG